MLTYINHGADKLQLGSPGYVFYHKSNSNSAKLIALMIGKGVKDRVSQFRDINRQSSKGIKLMEWNSFRAIHGMK